MNELLFMLWMGDIAEGFSVLLGASGFIGLLVTTMIWGIHNDSHYRENIPYPKKYAVVAACAMVIAALIPSKQFFYIAAGGTAAVQALDTEIGKKVAKLVELKLDEALGETK